LFNTGEDFRNENLTQCAQARLFANAEGVALSELSSPMSSKIDLAMARTRNILSRSSREISQLLNEIGFDHETEVAPDRSISSAMLAIDFACSGRKIAIEFFGTSHYLKALGSGDLTRTLDGATKAKRRFLEQIGWTVINLDYRDYAAQAHNEKKEKEWLRKTLVAAGVKLAKKQILKVMDLR